jgi:hypothetical protein
MFISGNEGGMQGKNTSPILMLRIKYTIMVLRYLI